MLEAFAAALESWLQTGIPDKPRSWLISTARFTSPDGDLILLEQQDRWLWNKEQIAEASRSPKAL